MGDVTGWVPVETLDDMAGARVRADSEALHIAGMAWAYLTPSQWQAMREACDALVAGLAGRKAAELAAEAGDLDDLDGLARGCHPVPDDLPPVQEWTDAQWAHVAYVLDRSPASFGLLREYWDKAGKALEG